LNKDFQNTSDSVSYVLTYVTIWNSSKKILKEFDNPKMTGKNQISALEMLHVRYHRTWIKAFWTSEIGLTSCNERNEIILW